MSQVPRKLPEEEEGDEEEEEEEEIVGLAGYADGAESFSDGDAESGGDEACECRSRRPQRHRGRRGAAWRRPRGCGGGGWGCSRRAEGQHRARRGPRGSGGQRVRVWSEAGRGPG